MDGLFAEYESEVRTYCRDWPTLFDTAQGSWVTDTGGARYLDFFAGAGALNYGHDNPAMRQALVDYVSRGGIVHSLDMSTSAKADFLETFVTRILEPRGLDYKVQFPGPTGTNAVEAALKLARKVTGRKAVVYFDNAFHGMTLGALAATSNPVKRGGAGVPLLYTTAVPFDERDDAVVDFSRLEKVLTDPGVERPAAVIVETVQGEGGVNVARAEWLRGLVALCRSEGVLVIVDDVQMGCGRTGAFFSFEDAGIRPDLVVLSKSIGGYGLPMALTLIRRDLDVWAPGEHNGTFRGNNLAFVTAAEAIRRYWADGEFAKEVKAKGEQVDQSLRELCRHREGISHRGRGLIWGLAFDQPELAVRTREVAFERRLLIETAGPRSNVVKLMPALTVAQDELAHGLAILRDSVDEAMAIDVM